MSDDANNSHSKPALTPDIQAKIGEKLKEAYSDVINEPVPDRFLDLLNQLEAGSSKAESASKSESENGGSDKK